MKGVFFLILIQISLKFFPKGPIANKSAFGIDNGLPPNRRQVIIWTNADPTGLYLRYHGVNAT